MEAETNWTKIQIENEIEKYENEVRILEWKLETAYKMQDAVERDFHASCRKRGAAWARITKFSDRIHRANRMIRYWKQQINKGDNQ